MSTYYFLSPPRCPAYLSFDCCRFSQPNRSFAHPSLIGSPNPIQVHPPLSQSPANSPPSIATAVINAFLHNHHARAVLAHDINLALSLPRLSSPPYIHLQNGCFSSPVAQGMTASRREQQAVTPLPSHQPHPSDSDAPYSKTAADICFSWSSASLPVTVLSARFVIPQSHRLCPPSGSRRPPWRAERGRSILHLTRAADMSPHLVHDKCIPRRIHPHSVCDPFCSPLSLCAPCV